MKTDFESLKNKEFPYQESIQIDDILKSIISSFETKCDMVMKQIQFRCKDLKSKGYKKLNVPLELLEIISDNYTANIRWVLQER